jgi:DNA recombination protein RmuC
VATLGRELHERLAVFDDQLVELGRGLQRAVLAYNRALGSLESRVLVSARKLGALSGVDTPLASPPPVELAVRGEPDTP